MHPIYVFGIQNIVVGKRNGNAFSGHVCYFIVLMWQSSLTSLTNSTRARTTKKDCNALIMNISRLLFCAPRYDLLQLDAINRRDVCHTSAKPSLGKKIWLLQKEGELIEYCSLKLLPEFRLLSKIWSSIIFGPFILMVYGVISPDFAVRSICLL